MSKSKFKRYNDGVIRIYREKSDQSSFDERLNVATIDDMDFVIRLDYEESSKREQDIQFAEQNGFSLSLKVCTRRSELVDNGCKAVINNYLYDVKYTDKIGTDMWLYLEGVRSLVS